jgi:hypothetical protein
MIEVPAGQVDAVAARLRGTVRAVVSPGSAAGV